MNCLFLRDLYALLGSGAISAVHEPAVAERRQVGPKDAKRSEPCTVKLTAVAPGGCGDDRDNTNR